MVAKKNIEESFIENNNDIKASKDNTWIIVFFSLLSAFITVIIVYIMISGGNIAWLKINWVKWIIKQELMNLEYEKVWGKDNYEIVSKMQKQQIDQYVAQYKQQNPEWNSWNETPKDEIKKMSKDEINALKDWSYFEWNENALISIYEFSDLECPFCIRQYKEGTIKQMLEKFWDKINTAFKHFPLDFHKNAPKEAEATLCAWELGWAEKSVEFHAKIFDRTNGGNGEWFSLDALVPLAKELGLNEKKFSECLDGGKMADRVKADMELGKKYGVTGTPGSVIVNNETWEYVVIAWAYPASEFESKINGLLK